MVSSRTIRSALRMAIQQAGSNACAASSINKVPNLRPVRTRLAELTNVQAMTRASLNKASLMRISSSVARSFNELISDVYFPVPLPCANGCRVRVWPFGCSKAADNPDDFRSVVRR